MTNFVKVLLILFIGFISFFVVVFCVVFILNKYSGSNEDVAKSAFMQVGDIAREKVYVDLAIEKALTADPTSVSFEEWNKLVNNALLLLDDLEKNNKEMDLVAQEMINVSQNNISFLNIPEVYALDSQEVISVFDQAPAGRRLRTLAKHFDVDIKKARAMLKVAQGEITADSWNDAADTFEKLENTAKAIKDTAKVSLYVGESIASGGSTTVLGSIIAQGGMLVGGADLILEVGEDVSNIALGYNNDAAAFIGDLRTITEPTATIFAVGNLEGATDIIMFGADQINSALQENKYLGVSVDFEKMATKLEGINSAEEMEKWMQDKNIAQEPSTIKKMMQKVLQEEISQSDSQKQTNVLSDDVANNLGFQDQQQDKNKNSKQKEGDITPEVDSIHTIKGHVVHYSPYNATGYLNVKSQEEGVQDIGSESEWELNTTKQITMDCFGGSFDENEGIQSYKISIYNTSDDKKVEEKTLSTTESVSINLASGKYIVKIFALTNGAMMWGCDW